ncbi:head-tail connector protein [Weissella kandleri]|uniref:head-tail connector protein n=1 Tax=Weissella kandleri TaxID=1616 RepID=UPI00387E6B57
MDSDEILPIVKGSLRLVGNSEDKVISSIINAAIQSTKNAIGSDDEFYNREDVKFIFYQAVVQLSVNNYLSRSASSDTAQFNTKFGYNSMVLDLKATYALYESEKSNE